MPITPGDSPQGDGSNKFLDLSTKEGHRGTLVARHLNGKEAIVLAMTETSLGGKVHWGHLYLVRELKEDQFPVVIKRVSAIPQTDDWALSWHEAPTITATR